MLVLSWRVSAAPLLGQQYYVLATAWRATTVFVVVWLCATVGALREVRAERLRRSVEAERLRLDVEINGALAERLERIRASAAHLDMDDPEALARLRLISSDARDGLTHVRRLVRQLRQTDDDERRQIARLLADGPDPVSSLQRSPQLRSERTS